MLKTKQVILMTVIFILFLPVFALAGAVDLPKTGQTTCYDSAGTVIACPGTGQDGEGTYSPVFPGPARGLRSARMVTALRTVLQV